MNSTKKKIWQLDLSKKCTVEKDNTHPFCWKMSQDGKTRYIQLKDLPERGSTVTQEFFAELDKVYVAFTNLMERIEYDLTKDFGEDSEE